MAVDISCITDRQALFIAAMGGYSFFARPSAGFIYLDLIVGHCGAAELTG
jgi:hypothetical protein